ncbi:MAG: hypothetical protein CMK59_01125 [Proteobacteria bacterium]|nr:hypothetical protein [Pseudomonadota bacterium]
MRQKLKTALEYFVVITLSVFISFVLFSYPYWKRIHSETIQMAQDHLEHKTSHPGWSFPGTIWSAPAALELPIKRRIAHAKLRKYEQQCPAENPGTYCPSTGEIIPRGGAFPEGNQPPGLENWTRAPAMEPIELSMLLGPDGEIREHLPLDKAPKHLIEAILASEDADFFNHWGVNFSALIRALISNLQGGGYKQGASTLTMQVVRNMNQKKEKTILRKVNELASAIFLDSHLTKEQILQFYLDMPYLGQKGSLSICGFEAASQHYFNKPATDLTISEAATLVGILPAPGTLRPDKYPQAALIRRNRVLRLLKESGFDIGNSIQEDIALEEGELKHSRHPAYVQATLSWLKKNLDSHTIYGSGLQVFTAMDLVLQHRSERFFPENLKFLQTTAGLPQTPPLQAAATIIDPQTGLLIAVYGGTQLHATDFNRATQARRQAGSSLKPLVYALAFSKTDKEGNRLWKSFSTLPNQRKTFPNTNGWRPRNNGNKYSDNSTLTAGLVWSQNIVTASLLESIGGPNELIGFADKIGFDVSNYPFELGLALGQAEVTPLEMTRFAATIVNGGYYTKGSPILKISKLNGTSVVEDMGLGSSVLSSEAALITRELMRLVILAGTGGASREAVGKKGFKGEAIGKTGTTDSNKDLWFMGSTATYSGALWIGYDTPQDLRASSSDFAAPLWGWWMYSMHKDIPYEKFDKVFTAPEFKRKWLCMETGGVPNDSCRTIGMPTLEGEKSKIQCEEKHVYDEKKKYEGLWRRIERRKTEKEAAKRASSEQENWFNPQMPLPSEIPIGVEIPNDHFSTPPKTKKSVPISPIPTQGDYP